MRFFDKQIDFCTDKARKADLELDLHPKSAPYRAHANADFDRRARRERSPVAGGYELHRFEEAGGVTRRKQLFRIGPAPVGTSQLTRRGHVQIQYAIRGHCPGIATARGGHLSAVENLFDQHFIASQYRSSKRKCRVCAPAPPRLMFPRLASPAARRGYAHSNSRWFGRSSNLVPFAVADPRGQR